MSLVDLDKLIVCCQPLYDARMSEMRSEIEDLKLQLFWAKHTEKRLEKLIEEHGHIINCGCNPCHVAHRTHSNVYGEKCRWQPVFEGIANDCGLTCAPGYPSGKDKFHGLCSMDADAHLCSGLRGDWVTFIGFGNKLRTTSWIELNKYNTFIEKICAIIYEHNREEHAREEPDEEDYGPFAYDLDNEYKVRD
jgi:hypothetical protein